MAAPLECPPGSEAESAIDEEEYLNKVLLSSRPEQPLSDEAATQRKQQLAGRLTSVRAPSLPFNLRVKRLGAASAIGITGVASVGPPLERLTRDAARRRLTTGGGTGLPLVQLNVLPHGLGVQSLQQQPGCSPAIFFPIETVSYAVMDTRMPRIFCFIAVEIAAGCAPVNPTCHAFLCSSVESCYRLVLAVTSAFNSAVNRSKAARRRPLDSAAAASAAGPQSSRRVIHLSFTGDHEEA